jgi:hypothetical protein
MFNKAYAKTFAPKKSAKGFFGKGFGEEVTGIMCRLFVARRNDGALYYIVATHFALSAERTPS